jgi:hypothetical protein
MVLGFNCMDGERTDREVCQEAMVLALYEIKLHVTVGKLLTVFVLHTNRVAFNIK